MYATESCKVQPKMKVEMLASGGGNYDYISHDQVDEFKTSQSGNESKKRGNNGKADRLSLIHI